MSGYGLHMIQRDEKRLLGNIKRVKNLIGRRIGETPEGYVIERLHKMVMVGNYTVTVRVFKAPKVFRLIDHGVTLPSRIMQNNVKTSGRSVKLHFGAYRDNTLFNAELIRFEMDVVARAFKDLNFRTDAEVVAAGLNMFGEIWATRGTVLVA